MKRFAATLLTATAIATIATGAFADNINTLTVTNAQNSGLIFVLPRQIGDENVIRGTVINGYLPAGHANTTLRNPTILRMLQNGQRNTIDLNGTMVATDAMITQVGDDNTTKVNSTVNYNDYRRITSNVAGKRNYDEINGGTAGIGVVSHTITGNDNRAVDNGSGTRTLYMGGNNNNFTRNATGTSSASISGSNNTITQNATAAIVRLDAQNSTGGTFIQNAVSQSVSTPGFSTGYNASISSKVANATNASLNVTAAGATVRELNTTQENVRGSSIHFGAPSKQQIDSLLPLPAGFTQRTSSQQPVTGGKVEISQTGTVEERPTGNPEKPIEKITNYTENSHIAMYANAATDATLRQIDAKNSRTTILSDGSSSRFNTVQRSSTNSNINIRAVGNDANVSVAQGARSYFIYGQPANSMVEFATPSSNNTANIAVYGKNTVGVTQTGSGNVADITVVGVTNRDSQIFVDQSGKNSFRGYFEGGDHYVNATQSGNNNSATVNFASMNKLAQLGGIQVVRLPNDPLPASSGVAPTGNRATINQSGDNVRLTLSASGSYNNFDLDQRCSNCNMSVTGYTDGGSVKVRQYRNNDNFATSTSMGRLDVLRY